MRQIRMKTIKTKRRVQPKTTRSNEIVVVYFVFMSINVCADIYFNRFNKLCVTNN
uniref:Uncharacterized protein n=1 Tax=Ciona intestinalis TaxID=7719 RepID=H2XJV6_CIOIN